MQGYVGPSEALTKGNRDFRRVLFTAGTMQLVLMSLKGGEAIGLEVHSTHDPFFRIESGTDRIRIGSATVRVTAGDAIILPAGVRHNLTNTGRKRPRAAVPPILPTPRQGRFSDYRRQNGRWVPFAGEAAWVIDGKETPYWRGTLTERSLPPERARQIAAASRRAVPDSDLTPLQGKRQ